MTSRMHERDGNQLKPKIVKKGLSLICLFAAQDAKTIVDGKSPKSYLVVAILLLVRNLFSSSSLFQSKESSIGLGVLGF